MLVDISGEKRGNSCKLKLMKFKIRVPRKISEFVKEYQ
jgi:hypothetical protein